MHNKSGSGAGDIPSDRMMGEHEFVRRGREWTKSTYCVQGGRLLKIRKSMVHQPDDFDENLSKSEDVASLEDDELEVE